MRNPSPAVGALLIAAPVAVVLLLLPSTAPKEDYQLKTLYSFDGLEVNCANTGVAVDPAGGLFGAIYAGGGHDWGAVFAVGPDGRFDILHSFNRDDGADPSGVAIDAAGNLHGVTQWGGAHGRGTVFKIDAAGNFQSLHSFQGDDGTNPRARVATDAAGNLYGTAGGGPNGLGVVFKIDAQGNFRVLHSFHGDDGAHPSAGVAIDADGNLHGTAASGGLGGCGVVFKIDAGGNFQVLHAFKGDDGAHPCVGVAFDAAGNLHGATLDGGKHGRGVVYRIDAKTGRFTVLASFNGANGRMPIGDLARDPSGNLRGVTQWGGAHDRGVVYKIDAKTGDIHTLFSFQDDRDGGESRPVGGLAFDAAGNLYGATFGGGAHNQGRIFRLSPTPSPSQPA